VEGNVIIADDDRSLRMILAQALSRAGCKVRATGTLSTLWRWLEDGEGEVLVTDVMMPDGDTIELIPRIKKKRPDMPIIVMSAKNNLNTAMRANQFGAYQYLPKPFDLKDLISSVNTAIKLRTSSSPELKDNLSSNDNHLEDNLPIVGSSPVMQNIYRILSKVINTDFNILIEGKSGTGKNLIAQVLHDFGTRRDKRFLSVNLSLMSLKELQDIFSKNFSSQSDKNIGTLFLDEKSNANFEVQNFILSFLNKRESSEKNYQDVKIISSSRKDLKELIENGKFREDLFYRLNEVSILIPLLDERLGDIPELAAHFLKEFSKSGMEPKSLTKNSVELIKKKKWTGNVRELRNFIGRLSLVSNNEIIDEKITKHELSMITYEETDLNTLEGSKISKSLEIHLSHYFRSLGDSLPAPGLYQTVLKEVEIPLINLTLALCDGNQIKAANLLGINRNTLRKKIKDYDLVVTRGKKLM
jgi:two-component system nitrogen regulation response regulator GlnG